MQASSTEAFCSLILNALDEDKAVNPVSLDLRGKTTIADYMIVASGTSQRHIAAVADKLCERLKQTGSFMTTPEGDGRTGWVLIDAGDIIVHLFSEEMREFYDIEKLWSAGARRPSQATA